MLNKEEEMDRKDFEKIDWELCLEFFHQEMGLIIKKVEAFLLENPEWGFNCSSPIEGIRMSVVLSFWLKPEGKRRKKIYSYPQTRCGHIKSEEMRPVARFAGQLEEGRNLRVSRHFDEKAMLQYEFRIADYKPFQR